MRVLKRLVAFGFFLGTVALLLAALQLRFAASGASPALARSLMERVGRLIDGQRIEQMDLRVRVRPAEGEISASATLHVRSTADRRRRLYFLLNDGLEVEEAWQELDGGGRAPLPVHRVWLVSVVELPRPLAADERVRIGLRFAGKPRRSRFNSAAMRLDRDDVLVTANDLWYPADLQGFLAADVEVTLPADLELVHNGRPVSRTFRGVEQTVRWSTPRPVVGLALVAGRYRAIETERDGIRYRVFLPGGVDLDGDRIAADLAGSDRYLESVFGPNGFPTVSLFVHRRLERAFHDGAGLVGMPARAFGEGDYGLAVVAHEAAHSWWGATVAERWLSPGTGGEWIVEGFSELSSWLAVREMLGEAALVGLLEKSSYDPRRGGTLRSLSAIDNALDPAARDVIYDKGGRVALMLHDRLGPEAFAVAARAFLDRFRQRSAGDEDLERVFAESSGQDLAEFFSVWVRGEAALDLALESNEGGATVRNLGKAAPPEQIGLWRFPPGGEPERQLIAVGATTPLGNVERLVLDPAGRTADWVRTNNVLPRQDDPRRVERSARGDLMVVYGEGFPWSPASVVVLDGGGARRQTWQFDNGLLDDPVWSADGTRIFLSEDSRRGRPNLVSLDVTDGSRRTVARGGTATGGPGATFVARGDRLLGVSSGDEETLVRQAGAKILAPLASADGTHIAYAAVRADGTDLRVLTVDGREDRLLLAWPSGGARLRWSNDGTVLYAVLAGDWDWQLWALPLAGEPRPLVREAARIADIEVEPGGTRVAMVAEAALTRAGGRSEVFVIDPATGAVQRFNLSGAEAREIAWLDADSLAVVASDPTFPVVPAERKLHRLRLSDGSVLNWSNEP